MTSGPHPDYGLFAGKVFISVAIVAGTLLVTSIVLWFAPGLFFLTFGAVLLAILIHGMSTWVGKITKLPDFLSALVVILTILGILFFIIDLLAPRIAVQAGILKQQFPDAVAHLRDQLESSSLGKQLVGDIPNIQELLKDRKAAEEIGSIFSLTVGVVADAVIFLFISLYLIFDPDIYVRGILALFPPRKRERAGQVLDEIGSTLRKWLLGRLLGMCIIGLLSGIGLWVIGIPLALTLGLLALVMTFVPYLGAVVSAIPPMLLGLVEEPAKALYVAALYLFIHGFEAYLITPVIQRRQVHLPPAMIIFAQVLFGTVAGLQGIIFATPITALAVVLIKKLYIEEPPGTATAKAE